MYYQISYQKMSYKRINYNKLQRLKSRDFPFIRKILSYFFRIFLFILPYGIFAKQLENIKESDIFGIGLSSSVFDMSKLSSEDSVGISWSISATSAWTQLNSGEEFFEEISLVHASADNDIGSWHISAKEGKKIGNIVELKGDVYARNESNDTQINTQVLNIDLKNAIAHSDSETFFVSGENNFTSDGFRFFYEKDILELYEAEGALSLN